MKKFEKKISTIKERVIQICEAKRLRKEDFFKNLNMTSANFRGEAKKRPLNSNAIENIITNYPDVNPVWLLTGKGDMLREREEDKEAEALPMESAPRLPIEYQALTAQLNIKDQQIERRDSQFDEHIKIIHRRDEQFDEQIKTKDQQIERRDSQFDEHIKIIHRRDEQFDEQLKTKDQQIERRDSQFDEHIKIIHRRDEQFERKDEQFDYHLKTKDQHIELLNEHIKALLDKIKAV